MSHDEINNPKRYDLFPDGMQAIDVIRAALTQEEFSGYCKGNFLKYRLRAGEKGDALKCLGKAEWYRSELREHHAETRRQEEVEDVVIWPTEERIDAIGQNGNEGEHYQVGGLFFDGKDMGDWRNWVEGDLLCYVGPGGGWYTRQKLYAICRKTPWMILEDDEFRGKSANHEWEGESAIVNFRWHSRPTTTQGPKQCQQ